jgi:hypothetical protein
MTIKTQIKIVRPWPAEQPRPPVVRFADIKQPANDHSADHTANDHPPKRKP